MFNMTNNAHVEKVILFKLQPYHFLETVYRRHLHRCSCVWWWHWYHQGMARPPARPVCQHRLTSGRSTRQMLARWQGQWQILSVVKLFNSEYRSDYISSILCLWSSFLACYTFFGGKEERRWETGIKSNRRLPIKQGTTKHWQVRSRQASGA